MAYLIDSHEYEDNEIGFQLYRALSLAVDDPAPWYELDEQEQDYYSAAARDFIRFMQRREGRNKKKRTLRLWVFDFEDNRAKRFWLHNRDHRNPETWTLRRGREKHIYHLGKSAFKTKDEALTYGWNQLHGLSEATKTALSRVGREIQEYNDGKEITDLDDMGYDENEEGAVVEQPEYEGHDEE